MRSKICLTIFFASILAVLLAGVGILTNCATSFGNHDETDAVSAGENDDEWPLVENYEIDAGNADGGISVITSMGPHARLCDVEKNDGPRIGLGKKMWCNQKCSEEGGCADGGVRFDSDYISKNEKMMDGGLPKYGPPSIYRGYWETDAGSADRGAYYDSNLFPKYGKMMDGGLPANDPLAKSSMFGTDHTGFGAYDYLQREPKWAKPFKYVIIMGGIEPTYNSPWPSRSNNQFMIGINLTGIFDLIASKIREHKAKHPKPTSDKGKKNQKKDDDKDHWEPRK